MSKIVSTYSDFPKDKKCIRCDQIVNFREVRCNCEIRFIHMPSIQAIWVNVNKYGVRYSANENIEVWVGSEHQITVDQLPLDFSLPLDQLEDKIFTYINFS